MKSYRKHLKAQAGTERGAALIEFSIVLPYYLLLVLGFFEFSRAVLCRVLIDSAARTVARYVSTLPQGEDCQQLGSDKLREELSLMGMDDSLVGFEGQAVELPDGNLAMSLKIKARPSCTICRFIGDGLGIDLGAESLAILEDDTACRDNWTDLAPAQ